MAPSAEGNGASDAAAQDGIAIPPPELNIILPPKDRLKAIERTAAYIARNGPAFEERIRREQGENPRVQFVFESSPYHAYYLWCVEEMRAGRGPKGADSVRTTGDGGNMPVAVKNKGPEAPVDFEFSARMPNISAQDLDVVKLTALFVAKNGRQFMTTLSQRESTNYQFDFLRPQHSLHQFFSRLVDQYATLLNMRGNESEKVESKRRVELRKNVQNRFHILDRAKSRAEWVKYQEKQKVKKEEAAEAERIAYAQIDWHDFAVLETIAFDESDETADLPPPTTLSDLQNASLEQKGQMSFAHHDRRIEEAMPYEMEMYNQQQQQQQQAMPQPSYYPAHVSPPPIPPQFAPQTSPQPWGPSISPQPISAFAPPPSGPLPPPPAVPTANVTAANAYSDNTFAQNRLADHDPAAAARASATAPMNIKQNYTPRPGFRKSNAPQTSECPVCHQQIANTDLQEHLRIELLDPKWKDQRDKQENRLRTTNLSTQDVAANLKRLASQRNDVFDGVSGEMISEEEQARRKRAAMSYDGVIPGQHGHGPTGGQGQSGGYGGVAGSAQGQGAVNIQEQLRYIQEKNAGR